MSYIDIELEKLNLWEGSISWLYLDSDKPPNATTAKGLLVSDINSMMSLPWKTVQSEVASPSEIQAEWNRVKALPGGMVAKAYRSDSGLFLDGSDIEAITEKMLLKVDGWLPKLIPNYYSFPDLAKVGCLDMGWNLGEGGLSKYRNLLAAANLPAPDFTKMAEQCGRNVSNPAFKERNDWTKNLFLGVST